MAGIGARAGDSAESALLRIEDLVVEFRAPRGKTVHAVSGISFDVRRGETLGLVGESGSGKSTVARAVLQLVKPKSGQVLFNGVNLARLTESELRKTRINLQMVFQDPISSLNPRRRIKDTVADPLVVWGRGDERRDLVASALDAVGLDVNLVGDRRPHEFSGGQAQRISIARALVLNPQMLVCDEPVSALDVSVQAQILNLFEDLKVRYDLTMLFISHDLSVVRNVSDRVAVMYLGKLCEVAGSLELFDAPLHPYTNLLLSSMPAEDNERRGQTSASEMPSAVDPPSGCRFRTRCERATTLCADVEPTLEEAAPGHLVACHHPVTDRVPQLASQGA
jgi:peptide/nickel transport system ATP-binding protein